MPDLEAIKKPVHDDLASLTAVSHLDGRYVAQTRELRRFFSEYGLIEYRVRVEIEWLIHLCREGIFSCGTTANEAEIRLRGLVSNFNEQSALEVKAIESHTNHDVKAVEYFLQNRLAEQEELLALRPAVHFGCTSWDINNIAYALILKTFRQDILLPKLEKISEMLLVLAERYADLPMLARTHAQPASPTTLGKEFANFSYRLHQRIERIAQHRFTAKMNGAVGNYNAHFAACPDVDWERLSEKFLQSLGLVVNPYTTQIEPYDNFADFFDAWARLNSVLIDLSRDIWGWFALNYFRHEVTSLEEVGSSTMPHKVNPIEFENAEGNLGSANALAQHFSSKLPISRWQRDLSDSTVLRQLGFVSGNSLIAYNSLLKGLGKLRVNSQSLSDELSEHPEVLAEAIQSALRFHGVSGTYEKLKSLTRGRKVSLPDLRDFIRTSPLAEDAKCRLLKMSPADYTGIAAKLARNLRTTVKGETKS